jgi:positive regulator of sigma E activity
MFVQLGFLHGDSVMGELVSLLPLVQSFIFSVLTEKIFFSNVISLLTFCLAKTLFYSELKGLKKKDQNVHEKSSGRV